MGTSTMQPPPPAYTGTQQTAANLAPPPPPAYTSTQAPAPPVYIVHQQPGATQTTGRTPIACNTGYWVTAGLSWVVWIFSVSASTAQSWYCKADSTDECTGLQQDVVDLCGDIGEGYDSLCNPYECVWYSQTVATAVISVVVIIFTVSFCRPFDGARCTSKTLGLVGGLIMVVYAVLQGTAFSCGIVLADEINGTDGAVYGETFDVAVSAFVFAVLQAIVIFCMLRCAGDGPAFGSCCCASSKQMPIRAPREQQPTRTQYTHGV